MFALQYLLVALCVATTFLNEAYACSDFLLNHSDPNVVVSGRTMDFTVDLKTVLEVVPKGTEFEELPVVNCLQCPQYKWASKYNFVAANIFGFNVASDGMNEKGLSAAYLYLMESKYPTPDLKDSRPMITSLVTYILGNFATVEEVKKGLKEVQVVQVNTALLAKVYGLNVMNEKFLLHVSVHDALGKNLVIEFLDGKMNVMDNNEHMVMTNDPNLKDQLKKVEMDDDNSPLPGGYSPVERFQRLIKLNKHIGVSFLNGTSYSVATKEQDAISRALHMLNTVQLPPFKLEATQWDIVRDHGNMKLYFRSNMNEVVRVVDLNKIQFNTRASVPVTFGSWFVDITQPLLEQGPASKTMDIPSMKDFSKNLPPNSLKGQLQSISTVSTDQNVHSLRGFIPGLFIGFVCCAGIVSLNAFLSKRSSYESL